MELTEEQNRATQTAAPNAIVVAGAGTGKTTVIVWRVLWLVSIGEDPKEIAVVTYTNEAARVVTERLAEAGITVGFCGTTHTFCLRTLREMGGGDLIVIDEEERNERLLAAAVDMCVSESVSSRALARMLETGECNPKLASKLDLAIERYQAMCLRDGVIDFESILRRTARDLMQTRLVQPGTWAHLIVDEYQDANELDWQIFASIPALNRFFVGDPLQSIMSFRGRRLREFPMNVTAGAPEVFHLTKNWRSTPEICAAASRLSKHAHQSAPKALYSFRNSGADVRTREFRNDAEEALALAVALHVAVEEKQAKYDDFAVLCRTNAIADYISEAFQAHDVPVRRLVPREVPDDWRRATRALSYLARPDSPRALRRHFEAMTGEKCDETSRLAISTPRPITGDADKLGVELRALGVGLESALLMEQRFQELPADATLVDLEAAIAKEGSGRMMTRPDGVFVGTIHGAKGREFDRVVLAGMEEEVIPGRRKDVDVEEERRVAYVGMTRARNLLWLTWARSRRTTWGIRAPEKHERSRFIDEAIGAER